MSRQTQHEAEVNVATKTATIATEVEKNYKKLMLLHINLRCDTVSQLRRQKSLSRQKKIMSRQ